jgi:SNF2 family DNA or RNA helicase
VDESTAFKNRNSARSKAMLEVSWKFKYRRALTGTFMPNTITDVWHQAMIIDRGERLGTNFFRFQSSVCEPQQVGPAVNHVKWVDKPAARDAVSDLLRDISIRHVFEECTDIPPNKITEYPVELSPAQRTAYDELRSHAILELAGSEVNALHAASLMSKLLQLTTGAVYNTDGIGSLLSTERYEIVHELVSERDHSLVVFNWKHERDNLLALLNKAKVPCAVIDGSTQSNKNMTAEIVDRFQAGEFQALLVQPQSAAHGLTLTKAATTIWSSPTFNAELYQQMVRRIYRTGQTRKTETIHIYAEDTLEPYVYDKLTKKLDAMSDLLGMLKQ